MAVVSDAMYSPRIALPYVSSSVYYDYVPPCSRENQIGGVHERAYDTAMETDDDYQTASCRLNNRCVIPEANARNRREASDRQQEQQQQQQQAVPDADTLRHRNRKRCNADLEHGRELKKFREGGGNDHVYCGTGSTKDGGLAKVRYEPASFHVNASNDINLEWSTNANERCCWAAGNPSLISNTDCKDLLSCNGSKLFESNAEYEQILFETHGCSMYHHHRLQLLEYDCIETEI